MGHNVATKHYLDFGDRLLYSGNAVYRPRLLSSIFKGLGGDGRMENFIPLFRGVLELSFKTASSFGNKLPWCCRFCEWFKGDIALLCRPLSFVKLLSAALILI